MDNGASSYRRFLDGDTSGFDELIEMYREPLIVFINSFLHNLAESEDVAEDAFMELIVHPKRYSFRSSFKTYLFAIARNKAVDRLRRERKLSYTEMYEADDENADLDEHIMRRESRELLNNAMSKMFPEYAAVIRLVYFEDMSVGEAARVLGKSKKQVANLLYRAKNSLRRAMEEEGFSYEK
jgi:RNA polymerase sigma-70 factor (ECF subfamily)